MRSAAIWRENFHLSITDETLRATRPGARMAHFAGARIRAFLAEIPAASRLKPVAYGVADQALAVGGPFLANVVLARTQTKEEYGMFALSYSIFTFLGGLHNAAILEPYTIYGSGRYREHFSEYLRLMFRWNALFGALLSAALLGASLLFYWMAPRLLSGALVGLGLTVGFLLSGTFLRRTFYMQGRSDLAAKSSLLFLVTMTCGIWLAAKVHRLDGFSVLPILALGWIAAGAGYGRNMSFGKPQQTFLQLEPNYWREHWEYARWVFATGFVFQLTTQGYYWLVAALVSVKDVAELKVVNMLVAPVDQVYVALAFLFIPALAARHAAKKMASFSSLWKLYALAMLGLSVLFALGVRIFGKSVMHILYAGKFDDLAPLLFSLALLPVLMGVGHTMNDAIKAAEMPRLVFFAYLASGAATFLGGIPLVIRFGLRGAVYGMLLSGATYSSALALGFLICMRTGVQPEDAAGKGSA